MDRNGMAIPAFMSLIVSQDGVKLQKDLGKSREEVASAMTEFNSDASWQVVELMNMEPNT